MEQPHSRRLFKARPTTRGLIDRDIVLRSWAGVASDDFVLDNEDPLRLLAVDDDRLYDALLSGRGCLPKSGVGVCQYTYHHY